jgi:multiple sugar transport system permease protein
MAATGAAIRPVGGAGRTSSGARLRDQFTGWLFALPFVAIFLVFLAGPIVASLVLSFTSFGLADLRNPIGASFVGLANYAQLFGDRKFLAAVGNTTYFVVAGVPLTLFAGLMAALALNSALIKFRTFFRVGYYLPVVTSIVAIAVIWRFLLHPSQGLVNLSIGSLGIDGPNWLADPVLAMPSIITMAVWRNMGFSMVIFLAGLQAIPTSLYEAARIDGAGRWQEFRHVTFPLLRPTLLFSVVTTTFGYIQLFEEPFVMTDGGPLDKTLSVAMYTYQQGFEFFHQGYAAAMSYAIFIVAALLAIAQFRLLRSDT